MYIISWLAREADHLSKHLCLALHTVGVLPWNVEAAGHMMQNSSTAGAGNYATHNAEASSVGTAGLPLLCRQQVKSTLISICRLCSLATPVLVLGQVF